MGGDWNYKGAEKHNKDRFWNRLYTWAWNREIEQELQSNKEYRGRMKLVSTVNIVFDETFCCLVCSGQKILQIREAEY